MTKPKLKSLTKKPPAKSLGQIAYEAHALASANFNSNCDYLKQYHCIAAAVRTAVLRRERKGRKLCDGWMYQNHIRDFRKNGHLALVQRSQMNEELVPVTIYSRTK